MAHCSAHDSRETAVAPETRGCDRAVELLMCPRWTFPRAWAQWWNTAPTDVHTKHLAPKTRSSREPLMHSHRARLRHGRGRGTLRPQTFHVKQTHAPRPRGCDRAPSLLMRPHAGRREHRREAVLRDKIQAPQARGGAMRTVSELPSVDAFTPPTPEGVGGVMPHSCAAFFTSTGTRPGRRLPTGLVCTTMHPIVRSSAQPSPGTESHITSAPPRVLLH